MEVFGLLLFNKSILVELKSFGQLPQPKGRSLRGLDIMKVYYEPMDIDYSLSLLFLLIYDYLWLFARDE